MNQRIAHEGYLRRQVRMQAAPSLASEDFLAVINREAPVAQSASSVYIRSALVCNDQPDSYFTQFTPDALRQIAPLLIGKPVLRNHQGYDSEDLPVGKWIDASVVVREGVTWVRGTFFMVQEPQSDILVRRIDAGIIDEVSISWYIGELRCSICDQNPYGEMSTCTHCPGMTYDGRVCIDIMPSVREVCEASLVWKGGQYGTDLELPEGSGERGMLMKRMAARRAAALPARPAGEEAWERWWPNQDMQPTLEQWFTDAGLTGKES